MGDLELLWARKRCASRQVRSRPPVSILNGATVAGGGSDTLLPSTPLGMKGRWMSSAQDKKKSALGFVCLGGSSHVDGFAGMGRAAQCCRLANERNLRADDRFVGQRQ